MGPSCGKINVKEKEIVTNSSLSVPNDKGHRKNKSDSFSSSNPSRGEHESSSFDKGVVKVSDQPTKKMERKKQKKVTENINKSGSNSFGLEETSCSNQKPVENDKHALNNKINPGNSSAAESIPISSMITRKMPVDKSSLDSILLMISLRAKVLYEQVPDLETQAFDLSQFGLFKISEVYKKITLADITDVTPIDLARVPGSINLNKAHIKSFRNNKLKGIAMKQLSLDSVDNAEYNKEVCEEVERTVKILNLLKEEKVPHIIELLGVFYRESYGALNILREIILIMELGDGSLEQIFNNASVEEAVVLKLLRGLAKCLAEAEKVGISHNDVKPMNIVYFESRKTFKLIDFDISSITVGKVRKISYPEGTPLFMSPELERIMLICKAIASPANALYEYNPFKSDVYSLGLTILSIMGVNFSYLNELRDIFKILEDQSEINHMLGKIFFQNIYSPKLLDILSFMLIKSPEKRCSFEFVVSQCDSSFPLSMDSSLEPVSFSLLEGSPKRESATYPIGDKFEILPQSLNAEPQLEPIQRESRNSGKPLVQPGHRLNVTPARMPELEHFSSTNVEPSPNRESSNEVRLNQFKMNPNRVSIRREELRFIRSGLIEDYKKKSTNQASSPKVSVPASLSEKENSELPIDKIVNDPDICQLDFMMLEEYQEEILDTQSMLKKIKKTVMAFEGYS